MFLDLDKKVKNTLAMIDDHENELTYEQLCGFIKEFYDEIKERCIVFILCENSIGAISGFLSCIENKVVPLMLSADVDKIQLLDNINTYLPQYIWVPNRMVEHFEYDNIYTKYNYSLLKTNIEKYEIYDDLSLLMTTSGSTGSPKFVRHSYKNLEISAFNISKLFELNQNERAMISLPINFTQGLSTVISNLYAGGTLLLTTTTLMNKKFWEMMKRHRATSFTGVPYSYEILRKLRFMKMDLPYLRIINQGGGRLSDDVFMELAIYAENNDKKFIATYGSTETTSRMCYLKSEYATKKCGSIGKAIENGKIIVVDEEGKEITIPKEVGELIYYGDNVTLGYSECLQDLIKGDERNGIYNTGDLAYKDEEGFIFIVGRKRRFLKLFGYRIGLDHTERMLKKQFEGDFACVGTDKKMIIYKTNEQYEDEIKSFLVNKTNINGIAFEIRYINSIPKNASGKTLYTELKNI